MTTHAGPHVRVEGECSWEFTGDGTHLFCTEPVVVGSDECDGTDHPHHGPRRIQLRRTKGWRKPVGAVVVSRPSNWGNPFRLGETVWIKGPNEWHEIVVADCAQAVELFRAWLAEGRSPVSVFPLEHHRITTLLDLGLLRGRDLACWCTLDQPCHADVLLEIANAPLDVSPPVARVEDAGSRPLAATVGDEGAVSRVRVGSRVRRRSEGRSGLPGQVDEP